MQKRKAPIKKSPQKNSPFGGGFKIYYIYGIIALIFLGLQFTSINLTEEITQTEFLQKLKNNEVEAITFVTNTGNAEIEIKNNTDKKPHFVFNYGGDSEYLNNKIDLIITEGSLDNISVGYRQENQMFGEVLSWILPLVFFVGIWFLIMKKMGGGAGGGGGQIFNIGKSKAKIINNDDISITFKDVAGLEGAKEEITEIVDFLKHPNNTQN